MKRRNFLAFIPALGAAPFLSTELLKTDDKIEIIKPKIIKATSVGPEFDWEKAKLLVSVDDMIIGEGYITNINFFSDYINVITHAGQIEKIPTLKGGVNIEGVMNGFFNI